MAGRRQSADFRVCWIGQANLDRESVQKSARRSSLKNANSQSREYVYGVNGAAFPEVSCRRAYLENIGISYANRTRLVAGVALIFVLAACSGSGGTSGNAPSGGEASVGGSLGSGGSPSSGGSLPNGRNSQGGGVASGGTAALGTGGTSAIVTSRGVNGRRRTGGALSTGGILSVTGGTRATGGNAATGGAANIGGSPTGESPNGWRVRYWWQPSAGGATSTGGSRNIGGTPTTGGSQTAGGTSAGGSSSYSPCAASPCKILPFGDSITHGLQSTDSGGLPFAAFQARRCGEPNIDVPRVAKRRASYRVGRDVPQES